MLVKTILSSFFILLFAESYGYQKTLDVRVWPKKNIYFVFINVVAIYAIYIKNKYKDEFHERRIRGDTRQGGVGVLFNSSRLKYPLFFFTAGHGPPF